MGNTAAGTSRNSKNMSTARRHRYGSVPCTKEGWSASWFTAVLLGLFLRPTSLPCSGTAVKAQHLADATPPHRHHRRKRQQRHLQSATLDAVSTTKNDDTNGNDELILHLALWFPILNDAPLDVPFATRQSVLAAVERVLCLETDVLMVPKSAGQYDPELLDAYDVCRIIRNEDTDASATAGSAVSPSVLDRDARLSIAARSSLSDSSDSGSSIRYSSYNNLQWSDWTITYTIYRVGEDYLEEAVQNNPVSLVSIQGASLDAMTAVIQLALDVSSMEGTLDDELHLQLALSSGMEYSGNNNNAMPAVYSSPVDLANEQFAMAVDSRQPTSFVPRRWYLMRFIGIGLCIGSIVAFTLLTWAAGRRQRHRELKAASSASQQQNQPSVLLVNPAGVDRMLQSSSNYRTAGMATTTNHNNKTHGMTIRKSPVATTSLLTETAATPLGWEPASNKTTSPVTLEVLQEELHPEEDNGADDLSHVSSLGAPYGGLDDDDDENEKLKRIEIV